MNVYNKVAGLIKCTIDKKKYEKEVSINDVYDAINVCPTCGSISPRKPVCKIQSNPIVEFLYCQNCKGYSASKMRTSDYLNSYYSNYYQNSNKKITFPGKVERFVKHIYKYIVFNKSQSIIKIMDFGGGDGSVGIHLGKIILKENPAVKKIQVVLVDYQKQIEFDDFSIEFKSKKSLDEVDCCFDIVIASAILEHIPELDVVLKKIFPLVKKGGCLYSRVPYIMPFKKIFKNIPLLYPMHIHDLGPSFWNRVINRYKLDAKMIVSRPPLAETEFKERFLYTLFGQLFKFPAFLERKLRSNPKDFIWNYVAGWETIIMMNN